MKQADFNDFTVLWTTVKNMYSKTVSQAETLLVFNAFDKYSLDDVKKAISKVIKTSEFAPTPASVIKAIQEMHFEDQSSLEVKANKWYMTLSDGFSIGHDIITDDSRAVIAFKQCFRNVNGFRTVNAQTDAFRRKDFIQAYVAVTNGQLQHQPKEINWIQGIYSSSDNPLVRFIGNIEKCKKIAKIIYQYKRPRYTTLNDIAEIEYKRVQREKLALSGTSIPQSEENASMSEYVSFEQIQKDMDELCRMLNVNKRK